MDVEPLKAYMTVHIYGIFKRAGQQGEMLGGTRKANGIQCCQWSKGVQEESSSELNDTDHEGDQPLELLQC